MKAIIVTGDRDAKAEAWRTLILEEVWTADVVIHGACGVDASAPSFDRGDMRGIDGMASYATENVPMPAPFKREGLKGGPMRNRAMLTVLQQLAFCGYTIEVHAFHDDLVKSKGTKNMVEEAVKAGVPTFLHRSHGTKEEIQR